jgi:multiple sugar transport system substrate-binding protein
LDPRFSLIILAALSLVLGVLRCDLPSAISPSAAPKTHIAFWNGFTGPDGRTMLGLIREFNELHPDIQVTMQRIPWGTYYNKLLISALDGRGPEVFVLVAGFMPRMVRSGFVSSVDELYADPDFRQDFAPALLEKVTFASRAHGLPLDVHPHGLYLNRDMLVAAGITDGTGLAVAPATGEEFIAAATAMKFTAPDGSVRQWGAGLGNWYYNYMSFAAQFGGAFFDSAGLPTFNSPENIAALQAMVDLVQKYQVIPPSETGVSGWVGFRQQRVAMTFDGIYMVDDVRRLGGHPYMGAPFPQFGPRPGTYADSHVLCVRENLTPAQRRAAVLLIRFLSDRSLTWASAGQIPARASVRAEPGFAAMPVQFAFARSLDHVMYPPSTPSVSELQLHIGAAVEKALRGRATPAEALDQANKDFTRYLQRDAEERQRAGQN